MRDCKILVLFFCITGAHLSNGQSLSLANYNLLTAQLDSIHIKDQKYRQMINDVEAKHGYESKEMQDLWKTINKNDTANLIQVISILEKYGWLGLDAVGEQGNTTIFLVIQHSDQKDTGKVFTDDAASCKKW